MNRLGAGVLAELPVLSIDEVIERVDAVSLVDVQGLASELFRPDVLSAAGIGPDEAAFRAALAPVSGVLAAA